MNGLFQAGAFCGSIGINIVADRFGRKMSIIVPSLLVLISGLALLDLSMLACSLPSDSSLAWAPGGS
jgi:hypothetical protein